MEAWKGLPVAFQARFILLKSNSLLETPPTYKKSNCTPYSGNKPSPNTILLFVFHIIKNIDPVSLRTKKRN